MRSIAWWRIGQLALAVLGVGVLGLLLTSTARGSDGVIRHTGYESGAKVVEGAHASTSHGLGTTTAAKRVGKQAGVALLKPGDQSWKGGGYRAEWHGDDHTSGPGAERWHAISFYFPKDWNQGSNKSTFDDRIIFQFADEGSPMFSVHIDANKKELFLRRKKPEGGFQYLARWAMPVERWTDIVIHVKWTNDSKGFLNLYADGKQVAKYTGRTLGVRDVAYSKWGIYGQPTKLYFDEVRIAEGANQLQRVSPQAASAPTPTPTPTPAPPKATPTPTPTPAPTQPPATQPPATPTPPAACG